MVEANGKALRHLVGEERHLSLWTVRSTRDHPRLWGEPEFRVRPKNLNLDEPSRLARHRALIDMRRVRRIVSAFDVTSGLNDDPVVNDGCSIRQCLRHRHKVVELHHRFLVEEHPEPTRIRIRRAVD